MGIPGMIAVYMLPGVRKQAGKSVSDVSGILEFSSLGDWNLELQLAAVGSKQGFRTAARWWFISAQVTRDLPSPVLTHYFLCSHAV